MTRTHEIRPDLDEGIDRKVLSQLRARFLKLNEGRMARAMEGLSTRQQGGVEPLAAVFPRQSSAVAGLRLGQHAGRAVEFRAGHQRPRPKPSA
jgi:hypothetical protein